MQRGKRRSKDILPSSQPRDPANPNFADAVLREKRTEALIVRQTARGIPEKVSRRSGQILKRHAAAIPRQRSSQDGSGGPFFTGAFHRINIASP